MNQPITDKQIATLLQEAQAAGDNTQVIICRAALLGSEPARQACAKAIAEAAAAAERFSR